MSWVERLNGYVGARAVKRLIILGSALVSSVSGLVSSARAATTSFIDTGVGTVHPMYGVPYTIVKYGPAPPAVSPLPSTAPSVVPPFSGGFDWSSIWNSPYMGQPPAHFTAPAFSHWFPSFPRLLGIATSDAMATIALIAYVSLLMAAVCGWTVRGGVWYLKYKGKK